MRNLSPQKCIVYSMTFQSARTQSYIFPWNFLNSCTATDIQGKHQAANFISSFTCVSLLVVDITSLQRQWGIREQPADANER